MNEWIEVSIQKPETGIEVDGYNEVWVLEDTNPKGIRPCFLNDDGDWTMAIWDNDQDSWNTVNHSELYYGCYEEPPTHWREKPNPPKPSNHDKNSN